MAANVITIKDHQVLLSCRGSTGQGTLATGSGLSGTGIGTISSLLLTSCTGPWGSFPVVVSGYPLYINFTGDVVSGVVAGSISDVNLRVSMVGCAFNITGTIPTSYRNSTWTLGLLAGTGLTENATTGCLGLFRNGDVISLVMNYRFNAQQTVS
jgi:hypothetical protein